MRFCSLLLLSLLALPVFAEHHRQHAVLRTSNVISHLTAALNAYDLYTDNTTFNAAQLARSKTIRSYVNAALTRANEAKAALLDETLSLQEIRRIITQPNRKENGAKAVQSASIRIRTALLLTNDLQPLNEAELANWKTFMLRMAIGWYEIDEASWHINDAILEEQFGQP